MFQFKFSFLDKAIITEIIKDIDCKLILEPGRIIVADTGILVSTKDTLFYYGVLIVGYNDNLSDGKGYFTFKNSWGKNWGDKGYGYISYDYFVWYSN